MATTESGIGSRSGASTPRAQPVALDAAPLSDAEAWKKWVPVLDRGARPLTARMIAQSRIGAGDKALDVGTGIGDPALDLARIVGARGHVLAIDPDPQMIDMAKERASRASLHNVEFRASRLEDLAVESGEFDVILCRWSLMFVDDLDASLRQLRAMLNSGGRLVCATWGGLDEVPILSLARVTVHRHFGFPPPAHGAKTAYALQDSEALAGRIRAAGFSGLEQDWLALEFDFESPSAYVEFRTDCTATLFASVGDRTVEEKKGAIAAVFAALQPYRNAYGGVTLPGRCCCTSAVKI